MDGCDELCQVEEDFECSGTPSVCESTAEGESVSLGDLLTSPAGLGVVGALAGVLGLTWIGLGAVLAKLLFCNKAKVPPPSDKYIPDDAKSQFSAAPALDQICHGEFALEGKPEMDPRNSHALISPSCLDRPLHRSNAAMRVVVGAQNWSRNIAIESELDP